MKIATKAQLDRAVNAAREVERLHARLTGEQFASAKAWAKASQEYANARAESERANRVLANIEAFNERAKP